MTFTGYNQAQSFTRGSTCASRTQTILARGLLVDSGWKLDPPHLLIQQEKHRFFFGWDSLPQKVHVASIAKLFHVGNASPKEQTAKGVQHARYGPYNCS
ncbi:uncharacterized protein PHALS_08946 [Plasmopara halstedii]|uniref:Uncharacterized protein n=1 Tax=Plasmopara halstedii TaxID=4781 RepID=A0A0P1AEV7_PLAHL|nr:uncharacterized protein PHALS_08946 [Plasmopara halstedii]CEG38900.1 hypothetical protein PHALS_08946 [Plasmopara halstedii]|eukprot:XP_024575269.1 hypothetical protein PHALS_08946 [Plasmopara halstedii]